MREFYLKIRSQPSTLSKIAHIFGSKGIDILSAHGQASDDRRTADLIFFVEMGASTAPAEEVLAELASQDFVIEAKATPRNEVYFEGFAFPLTSGGHRRVFVLDGLGWAVLVRSLLHRFGTAGGAILHDEGVSFGRELVDRMVNRSAPPPGRPLLLENLKALFRANGLGILHVNAADGGGRTRALLVDPVTCFDGEDAVADHFLIGVVRGALQRIGGVELRVEGIAHAEGGIAFDLVGVH